MNRAV